MNIGIQRQAKKLLTVWNMNKYQYYFVNYINYEAFGRDLRMDLYSTFTDYGWVEKVG